MNAAAPVTTNVLKQYASQATDAQKTELKKTISQWVGQTFFGELMKQVRSELNPNNPFNGGKGGKVFGAQYDQLIISKMAESSRFSLGDKIAEQWTGIKSSLGSSDYEK